MKTSSPPPLRPPFPFLLPPRPLLVLLFFVSFLFWFLLFLLIPLFILPSSSPSPFSMSLLLILPLRGRGWGHRHFDVVIITILFISKCQFHVNITTEWLSSNFSSTNYSLMTLISHGNRTNFWNYYECNLCRIRVWT